MRPPDPQPLAGQGAGTADAVAGAGHDFDEVAGQLALGVHLEQVHRFAVEAVDELAVDFRQVDVNSDGPVLVAEPTLTPVRSEGEL